MQNAVVALQRYGMHAVAAMVCEITAVWSTLEHFATERSDAVVIGTLKLQMQGIRAGPISAVCGDASPYHSQLDISRRQAQLRSSQYVRCMVQ